MKKLILAAILAASLITAEAQTVSYFGALTGGTNQQAAASTNTLYSTVYATNVVSGVSTTIVASVSSTAAATVLSSHIITIQPEYALTGAGTGTSTFRIDSSVDNAVWNLGVTNLAVAANGTNVTSAGFNIDTGGALFWRVGTVANTNASLIMTNIACPFGKRPGL